MREDLTVMSVRDGLIALLPRLRRFAFALCGSSQERDILLRQACLDMLDAAHQYQRGMPFDRWAYAEVYRVWLANLRRLDDPLAQVHASDGALVARLWQEDGGLEETARFIEGLPPPQRAALLLIHGEQFTHEDAARVLDTSEADMTARLNRNQAMLADRLSGRAAMLPVAPIETPSFTGAGAAA